MNGMQPMAKLQFTAKSNSISLQNFNAKLILLLTSAIPPKCHLVPTTPIFTLATYQLITPQT